MGSVPRRSGLLDANAECRECGWVALQRNAVAIAAQHAKRTGHEVRSEQTIVVRFNPKAPA